MNASHEWLLAFVPIDATPSQLRDILTAHTATVEELVPLRTDLAPIVVARVEAAERHPDSDHLWVTKVNAGNGELLDVICGAPNVTAGKLYPFAPVGTTMPSGLKIERRKIRGIVSNGMLCSARELGLGDEHQGILELDVTASPGTQFLDAMPIGDTRLVIDVGANRPDLLSHLGLARELAAITGKAWHLPEIPSLAAETPKARRAEGKGMTAGIEVRVDPDTDTRRYIGAVMRGVKVAPSPDWLARRLAAVEVRSINNVVDATNYVLHELGQPIHAFDAKKLDRYVSVRRATKNERLVTLDGTTRALPPDAIVIADASAAQAIAGVMGGRESEVSEKTTDLFIEVASFDPKRTRLTRKAVGLSTDASYRFERGVDPEVGPVAMDRVIRLITSLAGGELVEPAVDVVGEAPKRPELTLRAQRVTQVFGVALPIAESRRYLEHAGFEVLAHSDRDVTVRTPSWRADVRAEIDLVEEVARFHGYDKVPDEIRPFRPSSTHDDSLWVMADRLREALVGHGLLEVRPMPFVHARDELHVRVANPLSENEAFLRTSLLETLPRLAEFNLSHRIGDVRIFEIGSVFRPGDSTLPREQVRLGILIMGRRRPPHFSEPQPPAFDEWDAKAIAELAWEIAYPRNPIDLVPGTGRILWEVRRSEDVLGIVQRVDLDAPVWASPAFGIELLLGNVHMEAPAAAGKHSYKEWGSAVKSAVSRYRGLPTMPPVEIDLALLVPASMTAANVERVIRSSGGELLEKLELFDQYRGAGIEENHRSLAWRLTFRHPERTLRDKEIEGRRAKILAALNEELNVRQRST
jgi:phenylalanyl-tRNA synthetase beta chain